MSAPASAAPTSIIKGTASASKYADQRLERNVNGI
jgi:hypothetical protein